MKCEWPLCKEVFDLCDSFLSINSVLLRLCDIDMSSGCQLNQLNTLLWHVFNLKQYTAWMP